MSRRRAPGAGRKPRGPYRGNSASLSLRVRPETKAELEHLAAEHGRSLSQEMQLAVTEWIRRHQKPQRHVTGLMEAFTHIAQWVEKTTERRFLDDAFTAGSIADGIRGF